MHLTDLTFSEWDDTLPETGFGPFHTSDSLRVIDEHTAGDLYLFGGYRGEQPVGLMPLFLRDQPFVTGALSPPPGFGIHRMGPILMPTSPKRRKQEKINRTFIEGILSVLDIDRSLLLFRLSCDTTYADPRPFRWAGFDVDFRFTYRLDLESTTPDTVLKSFSKSLRREIQDGEDLDHSITIQGVDGLRKVYDATRERYEEQGIGFPMSWEFMRDLIGSLDDRARVYVAETPDGEFLSGIIALYSNDTCYFWKGGTTASYENVSVNSLLHWRVIEDILTDPELDDITQYDMYSANNERITKYKSKYGGDLVPYYIVESASPTMSLAKKAYAKLTY
ncbi:lipid II:glycine glycyltransferase FemX [Natrinema versiforme]|uniref:BioF2-like acetyltransferase domain-containing protein n=1 Tax=Natrinema versiforme JCM 10478 TaxID=1227496 RepID=L9Y0P9_9EURY|nr:GNAT family N-acetyltransferase [Natrinema versiforme]ELY67297.1 hypothetical protein C489_11058 [Natrinema versiforme JCM 10478]